MDKIVNRIVSAINYVDIGYKSKGKFIQGIGRSQHNKEAFQLSGCSDISINYEQCFMFKKLIEHFSLQSALVIGNAFGFSSAIIASVMINHYEGEVVTLDNLCGIDPKSSRQAVIACLSTKELGLPITNHVGTSPYDIPAISCGKIYDLVFIDGDHWGNSVYLDYKAVLPFLGNEAIFVFHDFNAGTVGECVERCVKEGLIKNLYTNLGGLVAIASSYSASIFEKLFSENWMNEFEDQMKFLTSDWIKEVGVNGQV